MNQRQESMEKMNTVKRLSDEGKKNREIADILNIPERMVYWYKAKLRGEKKEEISNLTNNTKDELEKLKIVSGFTPEQLKQLLGQAQISEKKNINTVIGNSGELKLAVLSDTHLNNKLCDIKSLHQFYADAEGEGVDAFVHAGDLTDGIGVYPGHLFELMNLSFDEQIKYVAENYPQVEGKNTYFISGNHDEARLKQGGINFGNSVEKLRKDMIHLGFYNAKIHLNGFTIELQHGGGSSPYAASYHLQKYMERIPQEEHIDLYVLGHYHRELFMFYRGAMAMLPGAFLKENLLAKRFKLGNNISGFILDIKRDKDGKLEYVPHLYKYK